MPLSIVLGRAGAGKTEYVLREISDALAAAPDGPPILLIVPEQATYVMERELASRTMQGAFSRVQVVGFRRLAEKVLAETGGASRPQISDLGKRLVLRRLLLQHRDSLQILGRAARQRTFTATLASAIWEFKTWRVSADSLRLAEGKLKPKDSSLAAKIHDLTLLYRSFEEFLAGRYHDPEDALSLLANRLGESQLVRQAHIFIDGFHWFTPQEYGVLEALMACADQVTVTLCLDGSADLDHAVETSLFHRPWRTLADLKETAARHSLTVTETVLPPGGRFAAAPLLTYLEESFFASSLPPYEGDREALLLAEGANRRAEVEGMARQMIVLCREKGWRWRDMAILVRDSDSYGDLLAIVLTNHGIPYFADRHRPVVHHPLAELILAALETVRDNWAYDPLFRCLKTDLFPVSREDIDALENYCLEFGLRGRRWTDGKPWQYVRRLTLDEDSEIGPAEREWLDSVNSVRQTVCHCLLPLQAELLAATTITAYTTAVYHFLLNLGVPERLEAWSAEAEACGDLDESRQHRQLWDAFLLLFDQMVETCGDETVDLAEYTAIIADGLDGLAVSLIPPGLDYVTVSSLERGRIISAKGIFIPGVIDGVLPQRIREEGLLSDAERREMAGCGLALAPGAVDDTFHEQLTVYTALTRAGEYLWLSYPLADDEGKALAPSLLTDRLKKLQVVQAVRALPVEPLAGRENEYLVHPASALAALAVMLRAGPDAASPWWHVYNWAQGREEYRADLARAAAGLFHVNRAEQLPSPTARRLYLRQGRLRGSVTRFEGYRSCPFQYFARYGLNLQTRPVFRLAAPDFGQFLHAILKDFGDRLAAAKRPWRDVSPEEASSLCRDITAELAPRLQNEILLSSPHYRHIQSRLERTACASLERLIRFAGHSSFQPTALEQSFGRGGDGWPPLIFDLGGGVTVELAGQIDRLDTAELNDVTYLLILDYKSGRAGATLAEVLHGLKLQLAMYLLAACQSAAQGGGSTIQPAGALYFFLKNPKVTGKKVLTDEEISREAGKQLRMPGWVLAEPNVIRMLDNGINGWSDHIKVYLSSNGATGNNKAVMKSSRQLALLMEHARDMVMTIGREIAGGRVDIAPYSMKGRTPCGYCDYQPLCQFDTQLPENRHRMLASFGEDEVWQILTREVER